MAVRETTDDGYDLETTGSSTGYACPACGAAVLNGQGLYACFECEFTLAPTDTTADRASDHPAFRC